MVYYTDCNDLDGLKKCAKIIDNGGVIVYPTDTIFGIGCDPTLDKSVLRLYSIKERPLEKSLPLLANDWSTVAKISQITPQADLLYELFWPGKLTLILKLKENHGLSKYVFNNHNNTIALRIPNCPCILDLIGGKEGSYDKETSRRLRAFGEELFKKRSYEKFTAFKADHDDMIIGNHLRLFSFCEHHLLPFFW